VFGFIICFLFALPQIFLCLLTECTLTDVKPGKTFEDLCRGHIEAFARGAENFALNTKLTERVRQWQEKLAPILEEEERRASFDIFMYSETLIRKTLESLQNEKRNNIGSLHCRPASTSVKFKTLTGGCSQSDVCRFFLASLSLANSGNLKIEDKVDEYSFLLISNKLEKPMESYRAPSQG
jgi:condensin-2 complex subunit H2